MNLYHLKYFFDSARLKSITKAAELNRVGQPAISKAIQNLEASFNKTLIAHTRNRFQLTDDGETVLAYCEKVFSATDELKDVVTRNAIAGEIRIGFPSSMAESSFLTKSLQKIEKSYPQTLFKLMLGRTDLVSDWVKNDLIDFGIVVDNIDISGFTCDVVESGFFHLVQHKSYKDDWRKVGVMSVEEKSEVKKLRQKYKSHYQEPLKTKMEIGSWSVIKKFVMAGLGAGYLPDYMIQDEIKKQTLALIEPKRLSVPYEIKIIRKAGKYLPTRSRLAIEMFLNHKSV